MHITSSPLMHGRVDIPSDHFSLLQAPPRQGGIVAAPEATRMLTNVPGVPVEAEEPAKLSASVGALNCQAAVHIPPRDTACTPRRARPRPCVHSMRRVLGRPPRYNRGLARRLGRVRRATAALEERVARLREENRRLKALLSSKEECWLCEEELTTDGEDVHSVLECE